MAVKLESDRMNVIPLGNMEDGQIGVIVEWTHDSYIGWIVQRHWDILIALGKGSLHSFTSAFCNPSDKCLIRILQKGEKLVIE